jgi:hypothetical protein
MQQLSVAGSGRAFARRKSNQKKLVQLTRHYKPTSPHPAIVLGAAAARPKVGPHLAHVSAKLRKSNKFKASPAGFEPVSDGKMASKTRHLGPSGPRDAPDRNVSHRRSWADSDLATARMRAALEAAIAEGRTADAARLATELAARFAR